MAINLADYLELFKKNSDGYLTVTEGKGGKLLAEGVFRYMHVEGKRFYLNSMVYRSMFKYLEEGEYTTFQAVSQDPEGGYPPEYEPYWAIRGKAGHTTDLEIKARILVEEPIVKGIFQKADNPEYYLHYIDAEELEIYRLAGTPAVYPL